MNRSISSELLPQIPENHQVVKDFNDYFIGMKEALGDSSPHTKEQMQDVIKFRERNPDFNTSGYTQEAEPDIYATSEPDYSLVNDAPTQLLLLDKDKYIDVPPTKKLTANDTIANDTLASIDVPLEFDAVSVPVENLLNIPIDHVTSKQVVSVKPTHALLIDVYNDNYTVVLPPKETGVSDLTPDPAENNRTFVRDNNAEGNVELSPDALLAVARYKVAELSVKLRGKSSKKLNTELRGKFQEALAEYKLAYDVVNKQGEATLKGEGLEHQTIIGLLAFANASEHSLFINAERRAYTKNNPRLGKVSNFWAKTGIVKRAVLGGGAGMAVTTVATGLAAVSGVGLVAAGAIGLSVKAAKSVGMYKLNKGAQTVKQFDKKASHDETLVSINHNPKRNMSDVLRSTSDNLIDTINSRVEKDQKENRRKLVIAVGAVAVGALAGSIFHSVMNSGGGNNHTVARPTGSTVKPPVTNVTPTHTPQTTVATRPPVTTTPNHPTTIVPTEHTPTTTAPPQSPTSGTPPAHTTPPAVPNEQPPVPTAPVEVPLAPTHPPVDITRPTWSLAHDFAPGHESQYMQNGIDRFNSIHNTHFALTPHNGSTWIMDNAHAISPAQMQELNLLMLEESLKTS